LSVFEGKVIRHGCAVRLPMSTYFLRYPTTYIQYDHFIRSAVLNLTIHQLFTMAIVAVVTGCSETGNPSSVTVDQVPGDLISGVKRQVVMKDIPAGTFIMGSDSLDNPEGDEMPAHPVTISAFKMQETEVTQEQYRAVMGDNLYYSLEVLDYGSEALVQLIPVETVTWFDAVRFCNALSSIQRLGAVYDTATWTADFTKNGYRLPTEAEWEYACRAGSATAYWWGADTNGMGASTWSITNNSITSHPVASRAANNFGLYDMAGNALEWCNDWYGSYEAGAVSDPRGPVNGVNRVLRGGSTDFNSKVTSLRCAARQWRQPGYRYDWVGFRVVCSP
jgi:formylglycine-generating enzyme required for sulfatase activity